MATREPKSKMRVVRALETMMETTPIEKVQVTRLCDLAGIGRTTFYDNFDNVFDVANWYWDQLVEDTIMRIADGLSFHEAHARMFERLRDEQAFFARAFLCNDYTSINQHGYRNIGGFYLQLVPRRLGRPLDEDEEAAMHFFNVGASDYCAEWVRTGMREDPGLMARTFAHAAPPVMDCLQDAAFRKGPAPAR